MSGSIDDIIENFSFLDDWDDRYRYLIELGRTLEPLPEAAHNEQNRVRGCASQVWIESSPAERDGRRVLVFRGDSDAHIVKGLVALTLALFSGREPQAILETDAAKVYADLGLSEHLTPQRSNGVRSMVERIKSDARAALAAGHPAA
jgi:cysteine desulfuration protein SufE